MGLQKKPQNKADMWKSRNDDDQPLADFNRILKLRIYMDP